jgi:hypothetical protein
MEMANLCSRLTASVTASKISGRASGLPPFAVGGGLVLVLFIGSLLLRLPFRADFLVNWDSVNFALATQAFDIGHHQPHPPGYIGYVVLGAALNYITGDPISSLTLVSAIAGAAAAVLLFLLGCQFMPRPYAAITAALFALSPVVWYYSEVPLTYAVEVALALAFLWTGYKARAYSSVRYLVAATVLLALLGAVRQSGAILLLPLWLYIVWTFPWRVRRKALAVLVIGNLVWLVPLLWLAGGPMAYLREAAQLADAVVTPVSLFALNLWGLLRNVAFVVGGFLIGINVGLVAIVIAYRRGFNPITRLLRQDRAFFLLWTVPALFTYLLIHTGQLGYVLLVLPIGFLLVGIALSSLTLKSQGPPRPEYRNGLLRLRNLLAGLVAIGVLTNVLAFFFLPGTIYAVVANSEGAALVQKLAVSASGKSEGLTKARARQYDLSRSDAHWQELVSFVHRFNPETTAVLAVPDGAGSYRQLAYYLPEYYVYGLGKDQHDNFGHLMTARGGENTFTLDGLGVAARVLPIPPKIQRIVIPDPGIYQHLNMEYLPKHKLTLNSGAEVVVIQISSVMALFADRTQKKTPGYSLVGVETSQSS